MRVMLFIEMLRAGIFSNIVKGTKALHNLDQMSATKSQQNLDQTPASSLDQTRASKY